MGVFDQVKNLWNSVRWRKLRRWKSKKDEKCAQIHKWGKADAKAHDRNLGLKIENLSA